MKRPIVLSALALIAGFGAFVTGCTTTNSPIISHATSGAPTNVTATTQSSSSVLVSWTRNSGDSGPDTVISIPSDGSKPDSTIASSTSSQAIVLGLHTAGVNTYSISVHGGGGTSSSVVWQGSAPPSPATNLRVNSLSSASIGVTWFRGTGDVTPDTVVAVPSDGSSSVYAYASSTQSSQILTGLFGGVAYSIIVRSSGASSSAISWAPAARSGIITLYESADNRTGHFCGLDLDVGNVGAVSIKNSALADIVLGSDQALAPSGVFLVSAGVFGSGIDPAIAKPTLFNDFSTLINGGLDSDYYTSDLSGLFPGSKNSIDFSGALATTDTHDAVMRVKTSTGHYARIDVIRQPSGLLWKTVGGYNAIDVRVSEQGAANLPYAGRGVPKGTAPLARKPATQTYEAN